MNGLRFLLCIVVICLCCSSCAFPPGSTASSQNHFQLQAQPRARVTYVAIGASDTYGIGTDDPVYESWPADLSRMLGSNVRLINLGIPGIDAPTALQVESPVALDAHPDIVTVWLAVNDLIDNVPVNEYQRDLHTLVAQLRSSVPHAHILLANVPDLTLLPHFQKNNAQQLRAQIARYNQALSDAVGVETGLIRIVDLSRYGLLLAQHPEYVSSDGFHPDAEGYAQLATIFHDELLAI